VIVLYSDEPTVTTFPLKKGLSSFFLPTNKSNSTAVVMDVSDDEMELEIETPENGKKGFMYLAFRLTSALLFPIFAFLFLSILLGFLAILMGHFSITTPPSLPFQCRILSSSMSLPLPTATPVILSLNSYFVLSCYVFFR